MYRLYVRTDSQLASVGGIDQPDAPIVKRTENILVLKVPGHKYWSQLPPGPTHGYAPAEYQVYSITKTETAGLLETIEAERLVDYPVREGD